MDGTATQHMTPLRKILQKYEEQLLNARQLARFKAKARIADGEGMDDPDPVPKSRATVSKVVEELSLSLLISGNPFPVVDKIREQLSRELGVEVEFIYPPGRKLRVVAKDANGMRPLTAKEQQFVDHSLDRITRQNVDKETYYNSLRNQTV